MKTFEERFTAWVDGCLEGPELAAFEKELEAHPEALEEKDSALRLGELMRTHLRPEALANGDFFCHQLLERIEADQPPAAPEPARVRRGFWTLPRMAFSGAFCLLLAGLLFFSTVPKTRQQVQENQEYVANILSAHTDDPGITATAFHSKEDDVTVLWLDGLKYMPENYKLK